MRTRTFLIVAATALALTGCGNHNLVMQVDILSYLDPAMRSIDIGPIPAATGGIASGEQALVDDASVNLLQGLSGVAEVHAVSIVMSAIVRDSTGSGVDTLRIYASDRETEPTDTEPIVEEVVTLSPGVTDTVNVTVAGDQRVADLFVQHGMRLTVTTSVRGPETGDALRGSVRLRALDAVVIAGRKIP
jgi:hypothetical protein